MGRSPLCHCPCGQSNLPEELCCNPNVNGPVLAFYEEVSASENPDYSVNVFLFDWDDPDGDELMWTAWFRGAYADPTADEVYYIKLIGDNLLCNSFIEAPFVQMSGMRLGDYVKINTYNTDPIQRVDLGNLNGFQTGSLFADYYFSNTEVSVDSEPYTSEINGYCLYEKYQDDQGTHLQNYYLTRAEICDDTYPVDSWPVRPKSWWGRQTAKFWAADPEEEQTIYYVASGYSNTYDRASLVIDHSIQIQMFMNTSTTETFFNPTQGLSYGPLFVNDAFRCCCDNYVTQFSSGSINIGPVRSDCWEFASGCYSMSIWADSTNEIGRGHYIQGGRIIPEWDRAHTPPLRYGVKFFDNYDDYVDFLNDRPMSGIAELVDGYYSKNSILVEDARELGHDLAGHRYCLDGSANDGEVDVDESWYFYPNSSRGAFYSSAGLFNYDTEAFDCCQRFMSIGLADQDPGILTGDSVISNEPSTARVYTTYGGDRMKTATISDFWMSGYYVLDSNGQYDSSKSYNFRNNNPSVDKGIIYLTCTSFSSTNANYISCGTYDYSDVTTIVNAAYIPYTYNSHAPLRYDLNNYYTYNTRSCGIECDTSGIYSVGYSDYKTVYFSQSGCLGQPLYLNPANYYDYHNPITVPQSEYMLSYWKRRFADRDARSCDEGPFDCSFCDWLSDFYLTGRPMKLVAYEFDINRYNTSMLMNFWDALETSRFAARYSYYKPLYRFDSLYQYEHYDCANDVPSLAKLLLDIGATLHPLDTDNRDGLRCGDAGFGEYHFLKDHTSATINSHMHMMYEPRCKNENLKARIGQFCGTLQDVYDGLGFFEMTSMTDHCGRNIGNPCNVYSSICPDCNDFSCSQGEHDSVYIAVKGNFSLDDIGEDFCINNATIDCSPTICYNGWGFEHDAVSWMGDSC